MYLANFRKKSLFSFHKNKDGSGAVEFALLAPVLIYITAGAVNFGYSLFVLNTMQQVAIETVRSYTYEGKTKPEAETFALTEVQRFGSSFTVTIDDTDPDIVEIAIEGNAAEIELFKFPYASPSSFRTKMGVNYTTPTYKMSSIGT